MNGKTAGMILCDEFQLVLFHCFLLYQIFPWQEQSDCYCTRKDQRIRKQREFT